jgi:hypothetical protein
VETELDEHWNHSTRPEMDDRDGYLLRSQGNSAGLDECTPTDLVAPIAVDVPHHHG